MCQTLYELQKLDWADYYIFFKLVTFIKWSTPIWNRTNINSINNFRFIHYRLFTNLRHRWSVFLPERERVWYSGVHSIITLWLWNMNLNIENAYKLQILNRIFVLSISYVSWTVFRLSMVLVSEIVNLHRLRWLELILRLV